MLPQTANLARRYLARGAPCYDRTRRHWRADPFGADLDTRGTNLSH